LAAGDRVRLSNAWLPTTFISTTQLRARVHSGLAPGSYDVMVARTDGTISVLPSAYRVFVPFNQYMGFLARTLRKVKSQTGDRLLGASSGDKGRRFRMVAGIRAYSAGWCRSP
jgi:hypothetical protein